MKCQEVRDNLSAYLDNMLSKEEARNISAHLLVCNDCRTQWEDLKEACSMLASLPEVEPPPEFRAELRQKLSAMPKPETDKKRGIVEGTRKVARSSWYKLAAVAAVFGMTLGITSLWNGGNTDIINHPEIAITNPPSIEKPVDPVNETPGNSGQQVPEETNGGEGLTGSGVENGGGQEPQAVVPSNTGGSTQPKGTEKPPSGQPESVTSVPVSETEVQTSDLDKLNLIATSTSIKISTSETNETAEKVLSIANKYNGVIISQNSPIKFSIPVEKYSSVIAELGNLDDELATESKQQRLNAEYRQLADGLKQKQHTEKELIERMNAGDSDAELNQELNAVKEEITELADKMKAIKSKANKVQIEIEITSKPAE
ncbi:MAG: DUF4349 domain-containing protein [Firmicutes bacterium]|nr:DUF4349 domain-containing protein [Bacillota bacterium]